MHPDEPALDRSAIPHSQPSPAIVYLVGLAMCAVHGTRAAPMPIAHINICLLLQSLAADITCESLLNGLPVDACLRCPTSNMQLQQRRCGEKAEQIGSRTHGWHHCTLTIGTSQYVCRQTSHSFALSTRQRCCAWACKRQLRPAA